MIPDFFEMDLGWKSAFFAPPLTESELWTQMASMR